MLQQLQLAAIPRRWRRKPYASTNSLELGNSPSSNGPPGANTTASWPLLPPLAPTRASALVRTRVEPKTFFAAERTFVAWLNVSVLLMFTSLSLMAGHDGLSGGVDAGAPEAGTWRGGCHLGTTCGAGAVSGKIRNFCRC